MRVRFGVPVVEMCVHYVECFASACLVTRLGPDDLGTRRSSSTAGLRGRQLGRGGIGTIARHHIGTIARDHIALTWSP